MMSGMFKVQIAFAEPNSYDYQREYTVYAVERNTNGQTYFLIYDDGRWRWENFRNYKPKRRIKDYENDKIVRKEY